MSAPEDREVSIYICAMNSADARALFEKAMEMIGTGKYYSEELITPQTEGGGCAQLFVFKEGE